MALRRFTWLLSLPLAAAGWLTAHSLAYGLVEPHAAHREDVLAETGHSYLAAAPLFAACALTLALTGFALAVHDGLRDRSPARLPVRRLALLPPVGFAVQEHLERLIAHDAFPVAAAVEPTFLAGMALQLPFAALAVLVASAVLAFGHALGRRAGSGRAPRVSAADALPAAAAPPDPALARRPVLAAGHGQRAPPRPSVA